MDKILVDTSVIIDYLRRKEKDKSLFYQVFSEEKHQPVIALVTVTELWAGKSMERKENLKFVEKLIEKCEMLFPNLKTAKTAGEILRKTDPKISIQDAQIAALALENKLLLLTLNKKDFQRVKRIKFYS